jgi:hypothetical protein
MGWMGHDRGMKSRVHPQYKTKYRVSNWADYDRALVRRGDITLWISEDAIGAWKPAPTGRRGGQVLPSGPRRASSSLTPPRLTMPILGRCARTQVV